MGEQDFAQLKLVGDYDRHVGDLVAYANDLLVPTGRAVLSRGNFDLLRGLIKRALRSEA